AQETVIDSINVVLTQFVQDPRRGPAVLVAPGFGSITARGPGSDFPTDQNAFVTQLGGLVEQALAGQEGPAATVGGAGRPLADGACPVRMAGETQVSGVRVRTSLLDERYLDARRIPIEDEVGGTGLALVDRDGILATDGFDIDERTAVRMADDALSGE